MIYLDLDGVFADFNGAVQKHCPGLIYQQHSKQIWEILQGIPHLFSTLDLLPNLKIDAETKATKTQRIIS